MPGKKELSRRNVAAMARQYATEAIDTLVKAMRDPDMRIAKDAAEAILDRGIGRPIAMTADVTDRLDDFTDDQLDNAIADLERRIGLAAKAEGEEASPPVTH